MLIRQAQDISSQGFCLFIVFQFSFLLTTFLVAHFCEEFSKELSLPFTDIIILFPAELRLHQFTHLLTIYCNHTCNWNQRVYNKYRLLLSKQPSSWMGTFYWKPVFILRHSSVCV